MAPMAASHRSVEFDVQPAGAYAVQLRLTPALLDALQRAEEAGHGCSIRFGAGPQGNVSTCGHMARGGGGAATSAATASALLSAQGVCSRPWLSWAPSPRQPSLRPAILPLPFSSAPTGHQRRRV